jgi:uncharacterized protein (TIGR03083 family)
MPLEPLLPVDTRPLFRPLSASLVALLRELPQEDWTRPTVARQWIVRDVVAHVLDSTLRRLSFHRDGMAPPSPSGRVDSERDFVHFINDLNAQWVGAAKRLSPRVLIDLYALAAGDLAEWFESLTLDAPALFPVSWAGEDASAGWFDIGREFTELWHHQQQIRMAVGARSLSDPRYLAAVIDVAMRGLPHAFRNVPAEEGQHVAIDISGASGGRWTLSYDGRRWVLFRGEASSAVASIGLSDDALWKLLFNASSGQEGAEAMHVEGPPQFGRAFLHARSVIV